MERLLGRLLGLKVTSELVTLLLHLADLPGQATNIQVKYAGLAS